MTVRTDHPDYLEHRCDILEKVRKSIYYTGEMIYKMREAYQWYFSMVEIEYARSFNTPISFCPYCGERLPFVSTE